MLGQVLGGNLMLATLFLVFLMFLVCLRIRFLKEAKDIYDDTIYFGKKPWQSCTIRDTTD